MKQIHRSEVKGQRSVLLTWTPGDRSPSFDDHSNHSDLQYNGRSLSGPLDQISGVFTLTKISWIHGGVGGGLHPDE